MPYNRKPELGKDELEGFENYAKRHYADMLELANLTLEYHSDNSGFEKDGSSKRYGLYDLPDNTMLAIFEKLATPRVFLIESWHKLSPEDKLSFYSKDYQDKAKAEAEAVSRKASKAL